MTIHFRIGNISSYYVETFFLVTNSWRILESSLVGLPFLGLNCLHNIYYLQIFALIV